MTIKVLDYLDIAHEYEIPDDTEMLVVRVVSGDEIVYVVTPKEEDCMTLDPAGEDRIMDFEDGQYIVYPIHFEKWNQRKTSYDFVGCSSISEC